MDLIKDLAILNNLNFVVNLDNNLPSYFETDY